MASKIFRTVTPVNYCTKTHCEKIKILNNFHHFYPFRMPDIRIVPLGAGQDVGRSCILVSIGNKNVMFDCGMHMGYNDERRFPDFNYIIGDQVCQFE